MPQTRALSGGTFVLQGSPRPRKAFVVSVEWEGRRRSALASKPPQSGSVAPLWIPAEMCPLLPGSGYSPCCVSETSSSIVSCRIITCVEIFTASKMSRTVPGMLQFCDKCLLIDDLNSGGPPREGMLRMDRCHTATAMTGIHMECSAQAWLLRSFNIC